MKNLTLMSSKYIDQNVNKRKGETKFGEHVKVLSDSTNIYADLLNLDVDYVILGISEDVGVYANSGKQGTRKAWKTFIKTLLNTQSNDRLNAKKVLVLGHLSYPSFQKSITSIDRFKKKNLRKIRELVSEIDKDVSYLISQIVKAGKTPIIVGGGHNNAYGIIKGSALAHNAALNVINLDAHSDFRPEEGRHSGNGFSYAYAEGFLKNYFILGLQDNYTSHNLFNTLSKIKDIKYSTLDTIKVCKTLSFEEALKLGLDHVNSKKFGVELDCDAIKNIASSAMTPSGFSIEEARRYLYVSSQNSNACYLHICEASPNKKNKVQIGKLISFLVTDFIKGHSQNP